MTILVSSLSGGGGLPKLDADLSWPSIANASSGFPSVTVDPSGGLTTILSLSGKFAISYAELFSLTNAENYTVKLTVDGQVIWNETFAAVGTNAYLIGTQNNTYQDVPTSCEATWLLEVQSTVDTSVGLRYKVRPIL